MDWRQGSLAVLSLVLAGCDRLASGPAAPAPQAAEAVTTAPVPDLENYVGRTYADFVDDHEARFNPEVLGIGAADRARLWRAMATSSGAPLRGGGAQAVVFLGCADVGCPEGVAVVAIDAHSGGAFVGVRDAGGADVLAPNDQLEALLRLNAPSRHWADVAPQRLSADAAPETARP
jgi:hypothetical protein